MANRKTDFKVNSTAILILLIGIIIAVNVISNYFFVRLDLTEDSIFTLSPISIESVSNLDDKIFVRAYFSDDIPAPLSNTRQFLQDQLDEFRAYSNGKLDYEFISENLDEVGTKAGIQPVDLRVVENDEVSVRRVYLGLVMQYEDKQEVMPFIQNSNGLEYDLTKRILKLTSESTKKIGFLTGHDEIGNDALQNARSHLSEQYQLVPVSLEFGKTVPGDLEALLVIAPKKALSDWDNYAIDQYIMTGGKVGFYLNKVSADISTQTAENIELNVDGLMAHYGIKVNSNLVQDLLNQPISVSERRGIFNVQRQVPYPFLPLIRDFAKEDAMVKDLENVSLYFSSTIDTTLAADKPDVTFTPIAFTSPKTKVVSNNYSLYPPDPKTLNPNEYNLGRQTVAATLQGKFTSYYHNKDKPQFLKEDSTVGFDPQSTLLETENARIFVAADGDFMQDNFMNQPDNLNFFLNSVDWLASTEGLIQIRSRGVTDRPLEEIDDGTKNMIKWGNSVGLPLLVLLFGLVRWQMRKNRKVEI